MINVVSHSQIPLDSIHTYAIQYRMLTNKLVALEAQDMRKLKAFAKHTKKTVNELIREAVKHYLKGNGQ